MFDHPGHGRIWVAVHTDITERKRAEEARKLFSDLIDQSGEAVFVIDPGAGKFRNPVIRGHNTDSGKLGKLQ